MPKEFSVVVSLDNKDSKELFTTNNFEEGWEVAKQIVGSPQLRRGDEEHAVALSKNRSAYVAPKNEIEEIG